MTAVSAVLQADIITMADGTVYNGRVLSEKDGQYVLEIQFSKNIKDQKTVAKSEVVSIDKKVVGLSEQVSSVRSLLPTADFLEPVFYEKLLKSKVDPLLQKDLPEADKKSLSSIRELLLHEQQRLSDGDVKYQGEWLTPLQQSNTQYGLDAGRSLHELKLLKEKGSAIGILKHFEGFEAKFSASSNFPAAASIATETISDYLPKVTKVLESLDNRLVMREKNYKTLSRNDLVRSLQDIERQKELGQSRIESAKRQNSKWFIPYSYDSVGLKLIEKNLKSEHSRLLKLKERLSDGQGGSGNVHYEKGFAALDAENLEEAKVHLEALKKLKLPENYLLALGSKFTALEEKLVKQAAMEAAEQEAEAQEALDPKEAVSAEKEGQESTNNSQKADSPAINVVEEIEEKTQTTS